MNRVQRQFSLLGIAFAFLTRIPFPGQKNLDFSQDLFRSSLVYYPLVGLFYGLVAWLTFLAGSALQLDPTLTAFVLLAVPFILNRFLHFDGLCDVLDGFLADRSPAERLAIMKDSRNGSFAMGGAVLFLLGKFLVILNLVEIGYAALALLTLAPVFSRWSLVAMAFKAHYPREQGTAFALVGRIATATLVKASLWLVFCVAGGFGLSIIWAGQDGLFPSLTTLMTIAGALAGAGLMAGLWLLVLRRISGKKIGGVTGDVLGCLAETSEALFLAAGFLILHFWA